MRRRASSALTSDVTINSRRSAYPAWAADLDRCLLWIYCSYRHLSSLPLSSLSSRPSSCSSPIDLFLFIIFLYSPPPDLFLLLPPPGATLMARSTKQIPILIQRDRFRPDAVLHRLTAHKFASTFRASDTLVPVYRQGSSLSVLRSMERILPKAERLLVLNPFDDRISRPLCRFRSL